MAGNWQTTFSIGFSWKKSCVFWLKFHLVGSIDSKLALVQVMTWCWISNKPSPGPMMTNSILSFWWEFLYVHRWASNWIETGPCLLYFRVAGPTASPCDGSQWPSTRDAVQIHPLQPHPDADLPHVVPLRCQRAAGGTHRVREDHRSWDGHLQGVPRVPGGQG